MTEKQKLSATMAATVEKIIKSPDPREPENEQIAVEGVDHSCQVIRIENALADEKGNEVQLKEGAYVRPCAKLDLQPGSLPRASQRHEQESTSPSSRLSRTN